MDSTYLQTVQKTMCKIHIHILSTHSIKTYLVIDTHYTPYVHICILYTSIHSNNVKVQQIIHLQQIGCATDSCAKVQQIMHMQCRGCALYGVQ